MWVSQLIETSFLFGTKQTANKSTYSCLNSSLKWWKVKIAHEYSFISEVVQGSFKTVGIICIFPFFFFTRPLKQNKQSYKRFLAAHIAHKNADVQCMLWVNNKYYI